MFGIDEYLLQSNETNIHGVDVLRQRKEDVGENLLPIRVTKDVIFVEKKCTSSQQDMISDTSNPNNVEFYRHVTNYESYKSDTEAEERKFEDEINYIINKCIDDNLKCQNDLKKARATIQELLTSFVVEKQSTENDVSMDFSKLQFNFESFCKFGKPYFKDSDGFPCPLNADAIQRLKNNEIDVAQLPRAVKWQRWEMKLLDDTVRKVALNQLQAPLKNKMKNIEERLKREQALGDSRQHGDSRKKTRRLLDDIITQIGDQAGEPLFEVLSNADSAIDWMRISASEFDGRRTANECRAMWNVCLAPGWSRHPWDDKETQRLRDVAHRHGNVDWDAIAEEHGNGRSAYQCFIQWQTTLNRARNNWTEAEDKKLIKAVTKTMQGHYIPFNQVAAMLPGRTAQQCRHRWTQTLNPAISNKPFTGREDSILFASRQAYHMSFKQIALLLPGRTPNMLRVRFARLEHLYSTTEWNQEDDELLMKLAAEQKNCGRIVFSSIAHKFPERTKQELRSRYKYLRNIQKEFCKKNKMIENKYLRTKKNSDNEQTINRDPTVAELNKNRLTRASIKLPPHSKSTSAAHESSRRNEISQAPLPTDEYPLNISVPMPSNLSNLVKLVHQSAQRGRKSKKRDYLDIAISEVFRSHYHQPKGRIKKYFSTSEVADIRKLACDMSSFFQTSLNWRKDEAFAKYSRTCDNLLLIYRRLHQDIGEGESRQPLPQNEVKIKYYMPPNVTTLIGMRTLLLEQRGLLANSMKSVSAELQPKVKKAGGILRFLPGEMSQLLSPQEANDKQPSTTYTEGKPESFAPSLDNTRQSPASESGSDSEDISDSYLPLEPECTLEEIDNNVHLRGHTCSKNMCCSEKTQQQHLLDKSNDTSIEENVSSIEDKDEDSQTYIPSKIALNLFLQRFLSLFYYPSIMSKISPTIQKYDDLFEGDRMTYVSDYEVELSEQEDTKAKVPENNASYEELAESTIAETGSENENETHQQKPHRLTKLERKRMLRERWARYRNEKFRQMELAGVTAKDELQKEEEEAAAELQRRKDAEVVRIPGKRGRPARRRRVRRRKLTQDIFEQKVEVNDSQLDDSISA